MSDKLKYRESKRIAAMINRVRDATDDDKPIKSRDRLSELELENAALKKKNAALKEHLYTPIATLLPSDPHDTRRLVLGRYKGKRLAKLPAGTVLYIQETKP